MGQNSFGYKRNWRSLLAIMTLLACINASADEVGALADAISSGKSSLIHAL